MMASDEQNKDEPKETTEVVDAPATTSATDAVERAEDAGERVASATLAATRYVHAAFFIAAILGAYLASKLLVLAWGALAEWPAAVRAVPQIVAYAEDQREGITLVVGGVAGTIGVIQSYRKEKIRGWADDVAAELARVTWPSREIVMNGTIVVVVASAIATVYVTILDRFWSFLTTLVYGA
jgi:preprotein translocase subunit SecE